MNNVIEKPVNYKNDYGMQGQELINIAKNSDNERILEIIEIAKNIRPLKDADTHIANQEQARALTMIATIFVERGNFAQGLSTMSFVNGPNFLSGGYIFLAKKAEDSQQIKAVFESAVKSFGLHKSDSYKRTFATISACALKVRNIEVAEKSAQLLPQCQEKTECEKAINEFKQLNNQLNNKIDNLIKSASGGIMLPQEKQPPPKVIPYQLNPGYQVNQGPYQPMPVQIPLQPVQVNAVQQGVNDEQRLQYLCKALQPHWDNYVNCLFEPLCNSQALIYDPNNAKHQELRKQYEKSWTSEEGFLKYMRNILFQFQSQSIFMYEGVGGRITPITLKVHIKTFLNQSKIYG